LKAALFGEVDPVTGVSANIMMGQPIRGGTSFSQIILDDQMIQQLLQTTTERESDIIEEENNANIDYLFASGAELFDPCSKNQFQTSMVLPDAKASMEEPDVEFQIVDA
jgi:hypothetical protein